MSLFSDRLVMFQTSVQSCSSHPSTHFTSPTTTNTNCYNNFTKTFNFGYEERKEGTSHSREEE